MTGVSGARARGAAHLGHCDGDRYGANEDSQKAQFHSPDLRAVDESQEIAVEHDIRTTLQA